MEINMQPGYTVEHAYICEGDDCIIVTNYDGVNTIKNYPWNHKELDKGKFDIGVWKIKKLKL